MDPQTLVERSDGSGSQKEIGLKKPHKMPDPAGPKADRI
jgi:hypothetical protein